MMLETHLKVSQSESGLTRRETSTTETTPQTSCSGVQKDATFFEEGPSPRERLGVSAALTEYDPYNPIFAKRIEGTKTESNVSFTIQSARTNVDGYLEMTVFDHGLDLESLKERDL